MSAENLNELFVEEIKDIYDAEKQLVKALPKMAKATESAELRSAFEAGHRSDQVPPMLTLVDRDAAARAGRVGA